VADRVCVDIGLMSVIVKAIVIHAVLIAIVLLMVEVLVTAYNHIAQENLRPIVVNGQVVLVTILINVIMVPAVGDFVLMVVHALGIIRLTQPPHQVLPPRQARLQHPHQARRPRLVGVEEIVAPVDLSAIEVEKKGKIAEEGEDVPAEVVPVEVKKDK